jgi:hypothetical protein
MAIVASGWPSLAERPRGGATQRRDVKGTDFSHSGWAKNECPFLTPDEF